MKVKLLRSHKHDGKEYVAGDTLTVANEIAEWLIKNRVATVSVEAVRESNIEVSNDTHKTDAKSKGGKK